MSSSGLMNIFEIFAVDRPVPGIGDGAPSGTNELPAEMWQMVLENLEDVYDFARAQLVSKTFHALVRQNCWTKVTRIHVQMKDVRTTQPGGECVLLEVDTGIREQKLVLSLDQASLILQNLSQKTAQVQSIGINFYRFWVQRRDQVLADFLDSLVAAKLKIKEVKMQNLKPPETPRMTPLALARFLSANTATITDLEVENAFVGERSGTPVPQLLRALRECRVIQNVKIHKANPLADSILEGKSQLRSLTLVWWYYFNIGDDAPTMIALVECGAQLRYLKCDSYAMENYIVEVYRRKRGHNHPLRTLETLKLYGRWDQALITRDYFPNLP